MVTTESGDSPQFEQAWPPTGARTMAACVTEEDTRDGWVRVTWLPDGRVTVQGSPAALTAQVPASRTEADVLAWAHAYGFASVFPPSPSENAQTTGEGDEGRTPF